MHFEILTGGRNSVFLPNTSDPLEAGSQVLQKDRNGDSLIWLAASTMTFESELMDGGCQGGSIG